MNETKKEKKGLVLGIFIILIIIFYCIFKVGLSMKAWFVDDKINSIITDSFYMFWGILFLMCFLIPHKSFIFRFIITMSVHLSNYKNVRYLMLLFSIFFILLGMWSVLKLIL